MFILVTNQVDPVMFSLLKNVLDGHNDVSQVCILGVGMLGCYQALGCSDTISRTPAERFCNLVPSLAEDFPI